MLVVLVDAALDTVPPRRFHLGGKQVLGLHPDLSSQALRALADHHHVGQPIHHRPGDRDRMAVTADGTDGASPSSGTVHERGV